MFTTVLNRFGASSTEVTGMIVSRREFSKLGALGLAAQAFPVARAEAQTQRRIGYCVIGLGRIAGHFMRGVT